MPNSRVLRERVAGQSAMERVVAAQRGASSRSHVGRFLGESPLAGHCRTAYRAALAELVVGDALDGLGQRWDVLHDLPLAAGMLEHLVIGPAGIFALHTLHADGEEVVVYADRLTVGGEVRDELGRAREDADEVAATLGASVMPLLVIVGARRVSRRGEPSVPVAASSEVGRMLTRAPRMLSGDEVARLSDLADLESTWPSAGVVALDTQALRGDFAGIRSEVNRARGRRVIWGTIGVGLSYGIVWSLIASFVSLVAA